MDVHSVLLLLLATQLASSTRLSKNVIPSRQLLDLRFDFQRWTYQGLTEIDITVKEERKNVWLYSAKSKITGIVLQDSDSKRVNLKRAVVDKTKKILFIETENTLSPGVYKIKISFYGVATEGLQGLIKSGYIDAQGKKHHQITTHFEPDKTREAFPCFDEPSYRVKIKLIVRHPASHQVNSAGVVKSVTKLDNGLAVTEFEETAIMSVYLLAINIHDMDKVWTKSKSGIPVTVLAPTHLKAQARITARLAADSLDFFEKYLGAEYPFKKLDLMGLYDFNAGGMENIAMIHLMYDCAYAPAGATLTSAYLYCREVIVHEVSHMWFGNMVSLKWWDDLWLKEGFARFITAYSSNKIESYPTDGFYMQRLFQRGYVAAIEDDKYKFTKPVRQVLKDSYGAAAMFNSLSYAKGSWILKGVLTLIGEAAFQKGLQKYFSTYQMKSANFDDFTACFDKISEDVTVKDFMESWLNEPGFPVVEISKVYKKTLYLEQSRYTPSWDYRTDQSWLVPVNFKSDKEEPSDYKIWDSKEMSHNLTTAPSWYLYDTKNIAFTLHLYEEANMMVIAELLRKDHHILTPMQRSVYVFNLIEHSQQEKLSKMVILQTSRYLDQETENTIVTQWVRALRLFKQHLYMAENTYLFDKYFQHLLMPHVNELMQYEIEDIESLDQRRNYQYLFYYGIKWGNVRALARAKRVIRAFYRRQHIHTVYLTFALSYYRKVSKRWLPMLKMLDWYPRSQVEYQLILSSLCRTRNPKQQLYILRYSRRCEKMPRSLKRKTVCYIAARNPPLAWQFFKDNYDYYFAMYGEAQFSFDSLLECVTYNLTTQEEYNDVRQFFEEHSAGTGKAGLKRGLDGISISIQNSKNEDSVHRSEDIDEIFETFVAGIKDTELT